MLRLAIRNIFRQRTRSLMMLAAIISGVVGLILTAGFIRDIYFQLGEAFIHTQTGHFQVARPRYFEFGIRTPEKYLIAEPAKVHHQIAALPGVTGVMQRLDFTGLLSNGTTDLAIIGEGVEPQEDAKFNSWLRMIAGRRLQADDRDGVMVGKGVADSLKLKPGDRVTLMTSTADGAINTLDLVVTGVFISFAKDYDDRALRIALPAAQELMANEGVSRMIGIVEVRERADEIVAQLRNMLPAQQFDVRSWTQLSDFYTNTVAAYEGQFGVIRVIIFMMVILSVANVVNMSIFERTGEFGTMRALGNNGGQVMQLIFCESFLLGCTGAVLGVLIGIGLALLISAIGIPMPPPPNMNQGYTAQIRLAWDSIAVAFLTGLIAPLPASLWPAWKMRRIPIVDALRENI